MIKTLSLVLAIILSGYTLNLSSPISKPELVMASTIDAKVLDVNATGEANSYTFAVTVKSPDTGCDRYADWWEVITPEGELLYRRVLLHSHVDEQPFTRTGGTVEIAPTQTVIVRVHMSDRGYSPVAQQGSVRDGFTEIALPADFALSLANEEPLPSGCNF